MLIDVVIVLNNLPPENVMTSSLTATSVRTQATNSLQAESYTVSLTTMTGDDNEICALPSDTQDP